MAIERKGESRQGMDFHLKKAAEKWVKNFRKLECMNFFTRRKKGRPPCLLSEIRWATEGENILPLLYLMAAGKKEIITKRLEMYENGMIEVDCPIKRQENIDSYEKGIAECQEFTQEMKQEVFEDICGLTNPQKTTALLASIASETSQAIEEEEKFGDLKELLEAAHESLTEDRWEKL